MRRIWPLILLVSVACGDDGSATDDTTGTTGGSDSGSSTAADESTGADLCFQCVPPAPADWIGPYLSRQTLTEVTVNCPEEAPNELDVVRTGVESEPAECGCECGDATGGCGPVTATWQDAATCDGMPIGKGVEATPDTCTPLAADAETALALAVSASESTFACPATPTANIPTASFHEKLNACAPDAMECEGGGVCIPDVTYPSGQSIGICISRDGDEACPAEYPTKHTFYRQLDDTRTCTSCSCESSHTCGGSVDLFTAGDCSDAPLGTFDLDTCNPTAFAPGDTPSVLLTPTKQTGECTPVGGEAMGETVAADPVTVCCIG